jgi:hypothetical protein
VSGPGSSTGTVAPHAAAHLNDKWESTSSPSSTPSSPPSAPSPAPETRWWRPPKRWSGGLHLCPKAGRHASSPLSLGHHRCRGGPDRRLRELHDEVVAQMKARNVTRQRQSKRKIG